jgi:hypothetical protein
LGCSRRCCCSRVALWIPVPHLLPVSVRVLCSGQGLSQRCTVVVTSRQRAETF